MSLDAISIPPANGQKPKRLLVALHGWGANAENLAPFASAFALPEYGFIFPNAPFSHPQVPGGKAWYSLETDNYQGLSESRQMLLNWLETLESATDVPLSRTILVGFSQGGAMTLDVGLNLPLGSLCCLSGYMHSEPPAVGSIFPPVLITHGTRDLVVPIAAARVARDKLTALGASVEYREFEMGHEIVPAVIDLIQSFISARDWG